jgi:hypothetical protein
MADQNNTEIKWWHQAFALFVIFIMINQIKGCLGIGSTNRTQNGQANTSSIFGAPRRDACTYINNQQYPYHWEDSEVGACVIKLPPTIVTDMVPSIIEPTMLVPQQRIVNNRVKIETPIGDGYGEWEGQLIRGVIGTASGEMSFVCTSTRMTNSDRGLCGIP